MLSSVSSALATTGNVFYRTASNRYFWAAVTGLHVTEIAIRALKGQKKFVRLSSFAEGVQHSYGLIPRTPLAAVAIVADFFLPCSNKKEEQIMNVRHFATQQSDKVAAMLPKVYRSFLMSLPFVQVDVKRSVKKSEAKASAIWRFGVQKHNTPSWLEKVTELP
jgi:hypothetical protein